MKMILVDQLKQCKIFILDFSNAIATVLICPNDYIRTTSVEKSNKTRKQSKINFVISTPNPTKTEEYAQNLQVL